MSWAGPQKQNARTEDWVDDDTRVRELAKPFGIDTEGNTHAVPGVVEIVEQLVAKLTSAERTITELKKKGRK